MHPFRVAWWVGLVAVPLVTSTASPVVAQEQTLRGEVVDPAMYLRDARHGPEAEDDTFEAVDGGQTLCLLEEDTGSLYLFLAEAPGEDPNELVYDYVNRKVIVKGTLYERGGLRGIVAASVEPVEPTETLGLLNRSGAVDLAPPPSDLGD